MNDDTALQISQAALNVLKPITNQSLHKMVVAYFQPTEAYADSFIRSFRKGSGILGLGAPSAGSPIASIDIAIVLKPNNTSSQWVGYTIDITNPETEPKINLFQEWPESGSSTDADPLKLQELKPHILALVAGPLTQGNVEPPRQSPNTMF